MTDSPKTGPSTATPLRRTVIDPALSEDLCISLPYPTWTASCGPACEVVWGLGRATSPAPRFRHRRSDLMGNTALLPTLLDCL